MSYMTIIQYNLLLPSCDDSSKHAQEIVIIAIIPTEQLLAIIPMEASVILG